MCTRKEKFIGQKTLESCARTGYCREYKDDSGQQTLLKSEITPVNTWKYLTEGSVAGHL